MVIFYKCACILQTKSKGSGNQFESSCAWARNGTMTLNQRVGWKIIRYGFMIITHQDNSTWTLSNIIGTSLIRRKGSFLPILLAQEDAYYSKSQHLKPPIKNRWASHIIPDFFLHKFWEKLWITNTPPKNEVFIVPFQPRNGAINMDQTQLAPCVVKWLNHLWTEFWPQKMLISLSLSLSSFGKTFNSRASPVMNPVQPRYNLFLLYGL